MTLLTHEQRKVCKSLKNNNKMVIRKADKSNVFVILDRSDYISKLDSILNYQSKFTRVSEDPTNNLKKEINSIIKANNAVSNYMKLPALVGDFNPGYIYGNCKIHKDTNFPCEFYSIA